MNQDSSPLSFFARRFRVAAGALAALSLGVAPALMAVDEPAEPGAVAEAAPADPARTLVHMLDYMAADYGAAVQGGEVVNQFEYDEMSEFAASSCKGIPGAEEDFGSHPYRWSDKAMRGFADVPEGDFLPDSMVDAPAGFSPPSTKLRSSSCSPSTHDPIHTRLRWLSAIPCPARSHHAAR
ncbi:MAG: hypothetical protein R3F11_12940 [Verrucomicrobiales bacterium]